MITKATILIRCLNEVKNLKILLPLLEKQTFQDFEIVFIDSGSTDGSYKFVESYNSKLKIILETIPKDKFSFGRSLNMAAEKSTHKEILISLSAHCFPTNSNWLKNIITPFDNKKVSIVFGRQVGDKNSWLSEASHLDNWFGEKSKMKQSPFINNGNSAFRYTHWKKYKFDEMLTGCEDIEFASKVQNIGGLIYYSAESQVSHFHDEQSKQIRNRYKREAQALKEIYGHVLNFSILDLAKGVLNEIRLDLQFRKENIFPKSDLFNIVKYRYNKNRGHFLGINRKSLSNEHIKDKSYLYKEHENNIEYLKKDYFYK